MALNTLSYQRLNYSSIVVPVYPGTGPTSVSYLVVGGGGGGGQGQGGGGGAGGYREGTGLSVSSLTNYPITVGLGGLAGNSTNYTGTSGGDSIFSRSEEHTSELQSH